MKKGRIGIILFIAWAVGIIIGSIEIKHPWLVGSISGFIWAAIGIRIDEINDKKHKK